MTTNNDISRDLGKLEGELSSVKSRLDKIDVVLERIDSRLARIEDTENQRKGALRMGQALAGAIGALFALMVEHFWK